MKSLKKKEKHYWIHQGRDVGVRPHPIPDSDESVETNLSLKMSDGVHLRADLYRPVNMPGPFPAIVEITPYGAHTLAPFGRTYASRGYLFLAVDCRGRYRSEGEWDALRHDQSDGQQVLRWLSEHRLCNGKIGSRGHSYSGYNQLLAAIDAPSSLKAMVVGVAPGDPFLNAPFQGGAYDLNDLFWLLDMTGRVTSEDHEAKLGKFEEEDEDEENEAEDEEESPEEREQNELIDHALTARPFGEVDLRLGLYHSIFREWVSHWKFDEYWKERSVGPHASRIDVPTLHISGWWDGNGKGASQFYEALRKEAKSEFSRENQRLLLGPWNHDLEAPDCEELPEDEITDIERGAMRDPLNDEMAWFDHYLKGIPKGESTKARCTLFLTGINRWKNFSDWPAPESKIQEYHLRREGRTRSLQNSPAKESATLKYSLSQSDPTPFGPLDVDAERMPFDNSQIQKSRDDLIYFDSKAFHEAELMLGPLSAIIYASADVPDFDVAVSLYDLYPNGMSVFLTDGILRARFQKGFERPEIVPPGEIRPYHVDLWHLGHVFRQGHKLRLQVASASHLRFDVNPCTGGDLAMERSSRDAEISIYIGPEHPSRLVARWAPFGMLDESKGAKRNAQ